MSEGPEPQRIQKVLAQFGIGSRREIEGWVRAGRIEVNGETVTELGLKIIVGKDRLNLDSRPIVLKDCSAPKVYWLFNKPDKTLCSRSSQGDKPTIFDEPRLAKLSFRLHSVGRLDYRTEGLLLLTNDGEFTQDLIHPSHHCPRHYHAMINRRLTREEEAQLRGGVKLADGPARPQRLDYIQKQKLGKSHGYWYSMVVTEGRNHLVRRLFTSFTQETRVLRLVRYGLGDLRLPDGLNPGHYRALTSREILELKRFGGGSSSSSRTRSERRES